MKLLMIRAVRASSTDIYEAVVGLSRSIAGRTDLRSLLSRVADSLGRIVRFDHVGLVLHDPNGNAMQGHILEELFSAISGQLSKVIRHGYALLTPTSSKNTRNGRAGRSKAFQRRHWRRSPITIGLVTSANFRTSSSGQ
jgi:transcriptional regulator with GAF, ATPase, and Fis domain